LFGIKDVTSISLTLVAESDGNQRNRILFGLYSNTDGTHLNSKILLEDFQNSLYKVILMDQGIFKS